MKNTIKVTLLTAAVIAFASCKKKGPETITNQDDYQVYLESTDMQKTAPLIEENSFWLAKHKATPNQYPYLVRMAGLNTRLFEVTADVSKLYEAEKQLREANAAVNLTNAGMLRSLAKNYITQHRFKEAHQLLLRADSIGENRDATQKMLFDVQMELGLYNEAQTNLDSMRADEFDYYIRNAKWNDYKGNLDGAISNMEKAMKIAEEDNDEYRMLWSYSNIADFYGHAGRIEDSYNHYLKTLAIDPNYSYALKGIAWIVFSKERNIDEARKIIESIISKHNAPDYQLFLADLAEYDGDEVARKAHITNYNEMLSKTDFGQMYNAYNIELLADDEETAPQALEIAKKEIKNRATPQTYDLLAWAYLKNGNAKKALEISHKYVVEKTFEPVALYHTAEILKANNFVAEAQLLKDELLEAIYELGPNMESKINAI